MLIILHIKQINFPSRPFHCIRNKCYKPKHNNTQRSEGTTSTTGNIDSGTENKHNSPGSKQTNAVTSDYCPDPMNAYNKHTLLKSHGISTLCASRLVKPGWLQEWDELKGPSQPKASHDSMIHPRECGKAEGPQASLEAQPAAPDGVSRLAELGWNHQQGKREPET